MLLHRQSPILASQSSNGTSLNRFYPWLFLYLFPVHPPGRWGLLCLFSVASFFASFSPDPFFPRPWEAGRRNRIRSRRRPDQGPARAPRTRNYVSCDPLQPPSEEKPQRRLRGPSPPEGPNEPADVN